MAIAVYVRKSVERENSISCETQIEYCKSMIKPDKRSKMGFYMGGRKTYGFDLEPTVVNNIKTKKLKPIPREIEHIKYIFDTYAVENVTLGRLLKNLNQNNIKLLSGGGWTTAKMSTMVCKHILGLF